MFCLDTNAVITALNEQIPQVAERLDTELAGGTQILLSTIVLYELHYGVAKSARSAENLALLENFLEAPVAIIAFEAADAGEAGSIPAALAKAGYPIGPYDVLVAAQARRRGATLVTSNKREFARVPGLMVTDWTAGIAVRTPSANDRIAGIGSAASEQTGQAIVLERAVDAGRAEAVGAAQHPLRLKQDRITDPHRILCK